MTERKYPFETLPLPYPTLEPYLSMETLEIHYGLYKKYVENLNNELKSYPQLQNMPFNRIMMRRKAMSEKISFYVGGMFNHEIYFNSLTAVPNIPNSRVKERIAKDFSDWENFEDKIVECGLSQHGSGYVWLVAERNGKLRILKTSNQDSPNINLCIPIFAIDVWEHSYFLDYKSDREKYIRKMLGILDWNRLL